MKLLVQVELSIRRDVGNATRWLKGMIGGKYKIGRGGADMTATFVELLRILFRV